MVPSGGLGFRAQGLSFDKPERNRLQLVKRLYDENVGHNRLGGDSGQTRKPAAASERLG